MVRAEARRAAAHTLPEAVARALERSHV